MFKALAQLWTTIAAFFLGLEKFANAFVSVASVAEDTANTFEQEEFLNNQDKIKQLKKKLNSDDELNQEFNKKFGNLNTEEK